MGIRVGMCVVGFGVVNSAVVGLGVEGSVTAVGWKVDCCRGNGTLVADEIGDSSSLLGLHKPLPQRIPIVTAPRPPELGQPQYQSTAAFHQQPVCRAGTGAVQW
jgi:hypothetical protein